MTQLQIKKIPKEWIIVGILLLITFSCSLIMVYPVYEEFTIVGGVVPVREAGIDGSVYFTYVKSGYIRNLYEKYSLQQLYDGEIDFTPVDPETIHQNEWILKVEDELRVDTIENAFMNASEFIQSQDPYDHEKLEEILSNTEGYYGDSLGLMIAIGLVEEWNHEDFAHGGQYKISGTGTLNWDNTVGSVGGIRQKMLTAEENNVDIFFVPKDKDSFLYDGISNQEEATQFYTEGDFRFQLVPVATLDEAIEYLRSLK